MLDHRDIAAVDDEDHAHCIAGQFLGALKEGNRFKGGRSGMAGRVSSSDKNLG